MEGYPLNSGGTTQVHPEWSISGAGTKLQTIDHLQTQKEIQACYIIKHFLNIILVWPH